MLGIIAGCAAFWYGGDIGFLSRFGFEAAVMGAHYLALKDAGSTEGDVLARGTVISLFLSREKSPGGAGSPPFGPGWKFGPLAHPDLRS